MLPKSLVLVPLLFSALILAVVSYVSLSKMSARRVFLPWFGFFLAEFYLLGPYSFIAFDGEGNLEVAFYHYLATRADGSVFSHSIGGGVDLDLFMPGRQYIQVEALLAHVLPTWLVILAHKAMVGALGYWGSWLLASRIAPHRPLVALAASLIFPVSHPYLLNYSTEFGTGFAAIPLAVFVAIASTRDTGFWWKVAGASAVVAMAEPMKVYPPLAAVMVAALFAFPGVRLGRVLAANGLYLVLTLANWHEVIYALAVSVEYTTRVDQANQGLRAAFLGLPNMWQTDLWPATLACTVALLQAVFSRAPTAWRIAVILGWYFLAFVIAQGVHWDVLGLTPFNSLSHYYLRLALPTIAVIVVSLAAPIGSRPEPSPWDRSYLAIGLAGLLWMKMVNGAEYIWFGGQASFFGYGGANDTAWRPNDDFRVVTLFDAPHPNITAAFYGFDAFDAGLSLDPRPYGEYWFHVMGADRSYYRTTRTRIDWRYWDGTAYDVGSHARLDLLRLANVRFLLSALPLKADGIRLVDGPGIGEDSLLKVRPSQFSSLSAFFMFRIKRIFDPGHLHVYELDGALPRIFAASRILPLPETTAPEQYYDYVAKQASTRAAVVYQSVADQLPAAAALDVRSWRKVPGGYDIFVETSEGGIVLVSNAWMPFWRAQADGQAVPVFAANGVQLAIPIPAGTQRLELRYQRPRVRELVAAKLRG